MSNELEDRVRLALNKLQEVDDLNEILALPQGFHNVVRGNRDPIQAHFRKALFPIPPFFDTGLDPVTLVRLAKALIEDHLPQQELGRYYDFLPPQQALVGVYRIDRSGFDQELVNDSLLRFMYYDYACLHNCRMPYKRLLADVGMEKRGALFKLVQIDKTFLVGPYGSSLIIKKQHEADWAFFEKLGEAIKKKPVDEPPYLFKAKLICAYFWDDEFSKMSYPKIVAILEDAGVLAPGIVDPRALAKTLNRQGLKKTRHTRN